MNNLNYTTLKDTIRIHHSVDASGNTVHHTVPLELTLTELIDDTIAAEQYEIEQQVISDMGAFVWDGEPIDTINGLV